ncbi:hypothetical protein A9239_09915 [Methanosarcina sp. A14]|nr:hypothetical protein A9239_09915 [Methanosarcina sp. A14]
MQDILEYTSKASIELNFINIYKNIYGNVYGVEIMTTDQEILARLQEIEKRMEKMEASIENINNILKKVEQNTYFGCYMPEEKLE